MEERDRVAYAAQVAKEAVDKTVRESIEAIRQRNIRHNRERYNCPDCPAAKCPISCPRYLTNAEPEMLFKWWSRTSPPDNQVKEYLQHIPAPVAKKGGSKSGRKRQRDKLQALRRYVLL